MRLRLIRHATLQLDLAGVRVLVDPQLDPARARPAVANTANPRPNPLVDLPMGPQAVLEGVDLVLLTHLHADHLDATAIDGLPETVPIVCQPEDVEALRGHGFTDLRPVRGERTELGLTIDRTGARHGTGEIGAAMGPVSGWVLSAPGEPTVYVAGDTIFCAEVDDALTEYAPDVVVVNAGAARFLEGDPITMTAADVLATREAADDDAVVVAVHLESVNHCGLTRAELTAATGGRVAIPDDGAVVELA